MYFKFISELNSILNDTQGLGVALATPRPGPSPRNRRRALSVARAPLII